MTLDDFDSEIHFTLFNNALAEKERGFVPMVGHSTDRRAIQHTREVFREDSIEVLMCFVGACKDGAHRGFDKFGRPKQKGNIRHRQASNDAHMMNIIAGEPGVAATEAAWTANLSVKKTRIVSGEGRS